MRSVANVNTNISLEHSFWLKCKIAAATRGISLNQLVKNGLIIALDEPGHDVIKVDSSGRATGDLRGVLKRKVKR